MGDNTLYTVENVENSQWIKSLVTALRTSVFSFIITTMIIIDL